MTNILGYGILLVILFFVIRYLVIEYRKNNFKKALLIVIAWTLFFSFFWFNSEYHWIEFDHCDSYDNRGCNE